jgi:hypothetical protein
VVTGTEKRYVEAAAGRAAPSNRRKARIWSEIVFFIIKPKIGSTLTNMPNPYPTETAKLSQ